MCQRYHVNFFFTHYACLRGHVYCIAFCRCSTSGNLHGVSEGSLIFSLLASVASVRSE